MCIQLCVYVCVCVFFKKKERKKIYVQKKSQKVSDVQYTRTAWLRALQHILHMFALHLNPLTYHWIHSAIDKLAHDHYWDNFACFGQDLCWKADKFQGFVLKPAAHHV